MGTQDCLGDQKIKRAAAAPKGANMGAGNGRDSGCRARLELHNSSSSSSVQRAPLRSSSCDITAMIPENGDCWAISAWDVLDQMRAHRYGGKSTRPPLQLQLRGAASPVILHVYHLARAVRLMQLPLYHISVEVLGCELYYSNNGIEWCQPCSRGNSQYIRAVLLGNTQLDAAKVWELLDRIAPNWDGRSYKFLGPNCQTFASALVPLLVPGASVPQQYCRFRGWGSGGQHSLMAWRRSRSEPPLAMGSGIPSGSARGSSAGASN